MARGFSGRSVERFFTNTGEALHAAGKAHDIDPFVGMTADLTTFPSLPNRSNRPVPFQPEDAWSGGNHARSVGDSSNIVVDPHVYNEVTQRVDRVDHQAGADLYAVAEAIEEMCAKIFIVPETVPHILAITRRLKGSLGRFRAYTEDSNINIRRFVNHIADADRGNTGIVAISTAEAERTINRVSSTANAQADNMERTASGYLSQASGLTGQPLSQAEQSARDHRIAQLGGQLGINTRR